MNCTPMNRQYILENHKLKKSRTKPIGIEANSFKVYGFFLCQEELWKIFYPKLRYMPSLEVFGSSGSFKNSVFTKSFTAIMRAEYISMRI